MSVGALPNYHRSMINELPEPVVHPSAWCGEELYTRPDWLIELTESERKEIEAAVKNSFAIERDLYETTAGDFPLPQLGPRLAKIQHDLEHTSGACFIRGLNVANMTEEEARRAFWAIATHLGTPVSQSHKGEKIFNVRDEGHVVGQPQARGPNTRKSLNFHTDRCDLIAFLCLRQAKTGGENQIVSSVSLFNEMRRKRPDLVHVLMQPFYYKRHNVDIGNARPWCRQPIFSFFQGHFAAAYLRVLIDRAYEMPELPDMTDEQREALHYLEQLANDPALHLTFRQEPGDLLLLNNWVTFHRRNEFEDYQDPLLRRLLLRIWLSVSNSRPLAPEFADNYGATEAGAIRGGCERYSGIWRCLFLKSFFSKIIHLALAKKPPTDRRPWAVFPPPTPNERHTNPN